ncbi:MAG TPA: class I SAM-dependent methyltransferase [Actinomycetota bacterium]|nr:class I SAM-dependent methyltransferase [Actinomycetota bacterium]
MNSTQQVLDVQRVVWSLGDYTRIEHFLRPASQAVVEACEVRPGMTVLDVGAGTGNLTLEAAGRGADVIASDLTPSMIERGKARSRSAGLDITWHEADAQNLPFEDNTFDVVASVFAAMFAPDADGVVREMLRVTKPGGMVALTSWAEEGYTGQTLDLARRYAPPPPEGTDTPVSWGNEDLARMRFEKHAASVDVLRKAITWKFDSTEEARSFLENEAPPIVAAKMAMPPERFAEMLDETEKLQERYNRGEGGRVVVDSDYLVVLGRKASG